MPPLRLSHLGVCVSDLERSLHFYCEALGFKEDSTRPPLALKGGPAAALLELPDVDLRALYLERDGVRLELLAYPHPGTVGGAEPRPMNRLGLSHLSFEVDDLATAARRVVEAGGRIHEPSRIAVALFALDPDGTRIELVQRAQRDVPA